VTGEQIVLAYAADGTVAVNHQPIVLDQLEARLRTIYAVRRDKTLFISGAPTLRYGAIVGAIDAAKGAGVERVGIITTGMKRQ
jgi:biopolymer transport protein ExbD